jgi:hypothetical protein
MKRLAVTLLALALLAAPLGVEAQPVPGVYRVGYLSPGFPPTVTSPVATLGAFRARLAEPLPLSS